MTIENSVCNSKTSAERWAGSDLQSPPSSPGGVLLCGACRGNQACRLGLSKERLDEGGTAWFEVSCPISHEGGPNVAHGGWTAAIFDDCLGHVPILHGVMSVTAELSVSFVKPVPIERPLEIRGWVERREGSRWYIHGEMVLLSTRTVLARAHGVWVMRDKAHFSRFDEWLKGQDGKTADIS